MVLDHERLDVYRLALDFVVFANGIVEALPRGRSHLADPFTRAPTSIVLTIAEGAGKRFFPRRPAPRCDSRIVVNRNHCRSSSCARTIDIRWNTTRHRWKERAPCTESSAHHTTQDGELGGVLLRARARARARAREEFRDTP